MELPGDYQDPFLKINVRFGHILCSSVDDLGEICLQQIQSFMFSFHGFVCDFRRMGPSAVAGLGATL